jgi:predicted nuclease with TOPRIM domain
MFFGSGDAVVKVERNSKDTYEKLIKLKKELAERIVEIDSEIQKYKTYINDMNSASSATESMKTLINNQISDAFTRFAEIEELFDGMVSDYNGTLVAEETVNLEKNRFVSGKLFSSGFIVTAIKCAGPLCIIVMIICAFHAFLVERKKYARRNQEAAA